MFKIGDCFEFEGNVIEIVETIEDKDKSEDELYKVQYFVKKGNKGYSKEGIISETLLKFIPTFPF